MEPSQRAFFWSGVFLLYVGAAALLGILVFRLCAHNIYLACAPASFLLGLAIAVLVDRQTGALRKRRLSLWCLSGAATVVVAFVFFTPLPLTGIALRIGVVPESMEFSLRQSLSGRSDVFVSIYRSRGATATDLDFILPAPIGKNSQPLRFYPGQRPRRLYYGRHFFPCDIQRLSYGTDLFFFYIALAEYTGRTIVSLTAASESGAIKDIDGHTLRVWGPLNITVDAARIRADSSVWRVVVVKCAWGAVLMGTFALALWSPYLLAHTGDRRRRVESFLAS